MNILQEFEMHEAGEILRQEDNKERFKIKNLEQVNWALRKLSAINEKVNEINSLANAEIDRIKTWQDKELKKLEHVKKFFEGLLEEYHRKLIAQNPKEKTITTPYGKISIQKIPQKWNYDDNKLLEWLKNNKPELIRVKEEPDKQQLKKVFTVNGLQVLDPATGELVKGITIQPESDKFVVEV